MFLKKEDAHWILRLEGNETLLMRYVPATGEWNIRRGNYITLGELFVYGARRCSCWDLYWIFLSLEIFIHKKKKPGRR